MTKKALLWRKVLPPHPAAEMFPLMIPDELRELREDIKKHGLHARIVVWQPEDKDDKREFLLDGRNRLDALQTLDRLDFSPDYGLCLKGPNGFSRLPMQYVIGGDPYAVAVSLNIHRRHLTDGEKRELIAELLKATPEKSNRQIATTVGVSHPHVAKVRKALEESDDVETVTTSIDTKGRKQRAKKPPTRPAAASSPAPSAAVKAESKPLERREAQARAVQDIGEHSNGENTRLRVRVEELENQKRLLEFENIGLKSELRDSISGAVRERYVGWLRVVLFCEWRRA
jgi:hypothetical protein